MSTTEEILNWLGDQNLLHMEQREELAYLIKGLFEDADTLVDGTTKHNVEGMTPFKKIELLERLCEHPAMVEHPMVRAIGKFVQTISKEGFRTAADFR